jgi:hypothetical protein
MSPSDGSRSTNASAVPAGVEAGEGFAGGPSDIVDIAWLCDGSLLAAAAQDVEVVVWSPVDRPAPIRLTGAPAAKVASGLS